MNTLISIVMAIVLNFLGVEVQERKLAANAQTEITEQISVTECAKISADKKDTSIATSIRIEHKCKLSK
ncbi:hypothetical protein [Rasiella sp. SM2506]|uniref:hypothetical protein n=1 Tax=Rasiella sp. SM2506 TaxID=3423914 RepID=UPI003D7A78B5